MLDNRNQQSQTPGANWRNNLIKLIISVRETSLKSDDTIIGGWELYKKYKKTVKFWYITQSFTLFLKQYFFEFYILGFYVIILWIVEECQICHAEMPI